MPWGNTPSPSHRLRNGNARQRRLDNARILEEHQGICHLCGQPGATEVDHVVALGHGGTDTPDNKRPAHPACHRRKTSLEANAARWKTRDKREPEPHPGLKDPGEGPPAPPPWTTTGCAEDRLRAKSSGFCPDGDAR